MGKKLIDNVYNLYHLSLTLIEMNKQKDTLVPDWIADLLSKATTNIDENELSNLSYYIKYGVQNEKIS